MFFIVGFPRSGTTLLSNILNNHSKIVSTPETHFFHDRINHIFKTSKGKEEILSRLNSNKRFVDLVNWGRIDVSSLAVHLSNNPTQKEVFEELVRLIKLNTNAQYVCEKTPQHLLHIENVYQCFPGAKFIHIIRDGRAAVNSLSKVAWGPINSYSSAKKWNEYMTVHFRYERLFKKTVYMSVRYEDLLERTETVMREIQAFLGIESEPIWNYANTASKKNFAEWEAGWKSKALDSIDSNRSQAWKTEMNTQDLYFLEHLTKKNLRKLAYPVSNKGNFFIMKIRKAYEKCVFFLFKIKRLLA